MIEYPVHCPLCITGHAVAHDAGFHATSCRVVPCENCRENYLVLDVTVRKSRAYALAIPQVSSVRHEQGLVEFTGAF